MSLFLRMDAACLEALTDAERDAIDPITYSAILEACAEVAMQWRPVAEVESPIPEPPATQWIRADLIVPDDFAWRTDLSFDQVEAVTKEAGEVVIVYHGARDDTIHERGDHLQVAVSPIEAIRWNADRLFMGQQTLQLIAEAYGIS